jgi:hypothetical protein
MAHSLIVFHSFPVSVFLMALKKSYKFVDQVLHKAISSILLVSGGLPSPPRAVPSYHLHAYSKLATGSWVSPAYLSSVGHILSQDTSPGSLAERSRDNP